MSVTPLRAEAIDLVTKTSSLETKTFPLEANSLLSYLEAKKREADIEAQESLDIIKMRKSWSTWMLITIVSINVFDFAVVILAGLSILKFEGWIMPVFIGDTLLKTIGLAVIIVNFLFDKDRRKK